MSTPQWITDRAPTRDDADLNGRVEVVSWTARSPGGDSSVQVNWKMVCAGTRWRPTKHWQAPQVEQMPIVVITETCGTCRFYRNGECRRHAPAKDWGGSWWGGSWPQPMSNDWCGEWEAHK